ncbi:Gfo/Idh/MocA family protein [Streptomyces sp. ST2-7A]|uniref:Gfo/Idh/MocA family protein n=1 Tax=Streptomyces sp. ST2-7A TaxID=2907214 RepID=UPI001F1E9572|nr:Gfo/Idh/MocA family oxidoreductase [Streptomyces sp. ST2-7A]MCE7081028.1 Gfo/Idh/MocA family oxidoreductase [Streptomyces sp. ST2-7A]
MGESLNVGIVGAGNISRAYLTTLTALRDLRRSGDPLGGDPPHGPRLTAVTDLDPARAHRLAEEAGDGVAVAGSLAELLAREDVDAVLNLTVPAAHAEVTLAALDAGKHVYGEKPLAADREGADAILTRARATGLRVGCAPDTVLGSGLQTARAAVDDGLIGTPLAASAFMTCPGHESWHPDPEFYYRPGGGPLLDMGPYYLSALVHLLGPVTRVTGAASRARVERVVAGGPRAGTRFPVEIDTHVTGVLHHVGGALTTLAMSFDVHAARLPLLEVYGTTGSLSVPDPNLFEGSPALGRGGSWTPLPHAAGYRPGGRGVGLADLADALRDSRPHLASAELGAHVLDTMLTLLDAAREGRTLPVTRTTDRPPAMRDLSPPPVPAGSDA